MAICPKADCPLSKAKMPQYGPQCMKCKTPLPSDKLPVFQTQVSSTAKATDQDWIDAARWALATLLAEKRAEAAELDRLKSEPIVKAYHAQTMGCEPDDEDVIEMAKKARENSDGLAMVAGWADFIVDGLQRIGQSPALKGAVKTDWGKLSATIKSRVLEMKKSFDIYTGLSTVGGGSMICVHYNLLQDTKPLKFSLAHESGHVADIALRSEGNVELQKLLRGKDSYAPKPNGDHELEYFADAFATLLLLASGTGKNEVEAAATELFKGTTVGDEHPSGSNRLNNISAVAKLHFGT